MNREELKALGLADEQVNGVMKLYGQSIVELQNGLTAAQTDSENAKTELKKHQKGGELYVDPDFGCYTFYFLIVTKNKI